MTFLLKNTLQMISIWHFKNCFWGIRLIQGNTECFFKESKFYIATLGIIRDSSSVLANELNQWTQKMLGKH